MKITVLQANVLENLHRIVFRATAPGRRCRPFLDDRNCHNQLIGLAAKRLIAWDGQRRPVRLASADGLIAQVPVWVGRQQSAMGVPKATPHFMMRSLGR